MITSEIFVAYTQCQIKSYLLLNPANKVVQNEYISALNEKTYKTRAEYLNKFKQKFPAYQVYSINEMQGGTNILIDANLKIKNLSGYADVLTKSENTLASSIYIPTIVVGSHKINKEHRLQLAFLGYVLSKIQKQKPLFGSIVGGDKRVHRIKTEFLYREVEKSLRKLRGWESGKVEPPSIMLNRHCSYCPFQKKCELEAKVKDHLSLLRGMSEKEIITQNKKGIFTVTQFSYTFRPKKYSKWRKNNKYYHSLKALAIRDKKIYTVERPEIPKFKIQIFLDVEAIPDQNFYYLIGVVIVEEFSTRQFSFWADNKGDESTIYRKLLKILEKYKDFVLFHYGSFETQFITRMNKKYSGSNLDHLEQILSKSINVLSMIYGKIYFPTYTNGLKEIGKYLGWKWTEESATGLQSLVWRHCWEKTHDPNLYEKLIRYNLEDCYALKRVVEVIARVSDGLNSGTEIVSIDKIPNKSTYKFGQIQYLFQELEFVNACAYFDYQREKIFFRDRGKKVPISVKLTSCSGQDYQVVGAKRRWVFGTYSEMFS